MSGFNYFNFILTDKDFLRYRDENIRKEQKQRKEEKEFGKNKINCNEINCNENNYKKKDICYSLEGMPIF